MNVPGGFENIEQQITYLDPYHLRIVSPTHLWRVGYRTSEMDPAFIRKLLSTHPELAQEGNKLDAAKRIALEAYGLRVIDRVPLPISPNPENLRYLRTKRDRMGHKLDHLDDFDEAAWHHVHQVLPKSEGAVANRTASSD